MFRKALQCFCASSGKSNQTNVLYSVFTIGIVLNHANVYLISRLYCVFDDEGVVYKPVATIYDYSMDT